MVNYINKIDCFTNSDGDRLNEFEIILRYWECFRNRKFVRLCKNYDHALLARNLTQFPNSRHCELLRFSINLILTLKKITIIYESSKSVNLVIIVEYDLINVGIARRQVIVWDVSRNIGLIWIATSILAIKNLSVCSTNLKESDCRSSARNAFSDEAIISTRIVAYLRSISSMFYEQLLCVQIPKVQKKTVKSSRFLNFQDLCA